SVIPYYEKAVNDVLNNTWKTEVTKWGTREGMNDLIKINDAVPEDVRKKIDALKAGLKDGSFSVFKGPLTDNSGKLVLGKNEVAEDAWKGGINFFVKGVEGKVPGGK
ncbi:MAG: BMP family ABC transporter substrate-binding protein, partial [Betaproteobacteria bacterium]|nr:BMP family ABC transporter substrate-binding protein [Betaproteobacteria bacterium]